MSRLTASNAFLWANCPASVHYFDCKYSRKFKTTNDGKRIGRTAHFVASNILKGREPFENICGKTLLRNINREALIENAEWYLKNVNKCIENQFCTKETEKRVNLSPILRQPNSFGKLDFCAYNDKHLFIFDYKTGENKVAVKENYQFLLYAIGMLLSGCFYEDVTFVVCHAVTRKVTKKTLSLSKILKAGARLNEAAIKAQKELQLTPDKSACKAGEHCYFCNGNGACPLTMKE